jgi:hypothetical protein
LIQGLEHLTGPAHPDAGSGCRGAHTNGHDGEGQWKQPRTSGIVLNTDQVSLVLKRMVPRSAQTPLLSGSPVRAIGVMCGGNHPSRVTADISKFDRRVSAVSYSSRPVPEPQFLVGISVLTSGVDAFRKNRIAPRRTVLQCRKIPCAPTRASSTSCAA